MAKILSRSGDSLADLYEVQGSIAGIETLVTQELPLVHEMGATLFSERLGGIVRRGQTGDIAQNTTFDVLFTTNFPGIWRILNVAILADVGARLTMAQLSLVDPTSGREVPLFVWNAAVDGGRNLRIVENGAAATTLVYLVGAPLQVPSLGVGSGQRDQLSQFAFRGLTSGFGAGTVELTALIYVAFTHAGGLSSRGIPIPSW